ncbi:hypothetical protein F11_01775 [Rhodospirillum rubrum F11]|uniref:MmeI-like DNA-methyltransferase domain-containing protein n=1 Tax=Rhodospirillum rubrum (strain ATCC 11170 / ATH 1.1.1 / DSM 467 / LMG 4362 / NCIMB 8255 / S1) TaxID=269796 RepID=Q2RXJ1_RHORT|nr:hypothetical protein Rru_A0349 [Rhodospirillum rubrum ATCC 11170]AEO46825.1 hypothetical protein F11_01775 [Rhodospirillum rubrum F11]HAP99246.1 hypothetical protein [Rhodospirillum rubrum]HCF17333.1 hypothetical protein [Rhodospirillum rubrum]
MTASRWNDFLVIAYKEMRAIEAEIARLALIIAEYQADVLYRGQKLALAEFLPLNKENWITCGNALRLDWLSIRVVRMLVYPHECGGTNRNARNELPAEGLSPRVRGNQRLEPRAR